MTQSGFFLGFLFGSIVSGKLADSIGRRKVTIVILFAGAIISTLTALSPNIYLFSLCRFGMGWIIAGSVPFYVLISEIIGPSYRGFLAVGCSFMFAVGFVILSCATYAIGEWRSLMFLCSLLFLPFLAMYRYGRG